MVTVQQKSIEKRAEYTKKSYWEKKLFESGEEKIYGFILLHYNARPHNAGVTQRLLKKFDYPSYSPDLAPSDFHLFAELKK